MHALTITHAFGGYDVGETITDRDAVKAALASNPAHVVRTKLPDTPVTKAKPVKAAPAARRATKPPAPKADTPAEAPAASNEPASPASDDKPAS